MNIDIDDLGHAKIWDEMQSVRNTPDYYRGMVESLETDLMMAQAVHRAAVVKYVAAVAKNQGLHVGRPVWHDGDTVYVARIEGVSSTGRARIGVRRRADGTGPIISIGADWQEINLVRA